MIIMPAALEGAPFMTGRKTLQRDCPSRADSYDLLAQNFLGLINIGALILPPRLRRVTV